MALVQLAFSTGWPLISWLTVYVSASLVYSKGTGTFVEGFQKEIPLLYLFTLTYCPMASLWLIRNLAGPIWNEYPVARLFGVNSDPETARLMLEGGAIFYVVSKLKFYRSYWLYRLRNANPVCERFLPLLFAADFDQNFKEGRGCFAFFFDISQLGDKHRDLKWHTLRTNTIPWELCHKTSFAIADMMLFYMTGVLRFRYLLNTYTMDLPWVPVREANRYHFHWRRLSI